MTQENHSPYTFQITAAVLCACTDYMQENQRSFKYVAEYAEAVYEQVFGKAQDQTIQALFLASFSRVYDTTLKLIERKVPVFEDLVKKIKSLHYDEQHKAVLGFVLEMLRTGNFRHYYRNIIPDRDEALEVVTTATFIKFCLNEKNHVTWQGEDLTHFSSVVLSALVFIEEPIQQEVLEMIAASYTLLELLKEHSPERMAEVCEFITATDSPGAGMQKALLHLYTYLVPELDEATREIVDQIFFRSKAFSERGILSVGSEEVPTCLILHCKEHPQVVGDILVHVGQQGEALHVFACEEHREGVKRRLQKRHVEQVAEQLADYYGLTQSKPAQITWRKTTEEKRKHVGKISQLIERYRYHQVADKGRDSSLLPVHIAGERGWAFFEHFVSGYTDLAKKKELDSSAIALLSALPVLDMQGMIPYLDEGLTWITFEEPFETKSGEIMGMCWGTSTEEMFQRALKKYPLPTKQAEQMHDILVDHFYPWKQAGQDVSGWKAIGLDFVNEWGETIWSITAYLVPNNSGGYSYQFVQNLEYVQCDTPECRVTGSVPCAQCMKRIEENLSLFVNILRIRRGEFGVGTSVPSHRIRHQEIVRKEINPDKLHKYQDITYRYDYEIVTINALHLRKPDPQKATGYSRGSWISRLDPEQIIYVPENIELRIRKLKAPIYWDTIRAAGFDPEDPEFEGYPIYVKAHVRNKPMKVETLLKRVERIVAK